MVLQPLRVNRSYNNASMMPPYGLRAKASVHAPSHRIAKAAWTTQIGGARTD